ncbi:MAG: NADH-ubiquinone oxidoreductase-F iron-sulfur binding region domain-containing protein [Desertimonas sp.]
MERDAGAPTPTDAERAAIDAVVGSDAGGIHDDHRDERSLRTAVGGGEYRRRRHHLLGAIHAVNDRVGWVSPGAVHHLARRLDLGPADVYGVVSFYALFATTERPARQVHACTDLACRAMGGPDAADLPGNVHASPCLGLCERAPAVLVLEAGDPPRRGVAGPVDHDAMVTLGDGAWPRAEPAPAASIGAARAAQQPLSLLARAGRVDPGALADYRASGGYDALVRAIEIGPPAVIDTVTAAGLIGRGGAAFPTGRKWAAVAAQPALPHHLVVNADESEPGTFKDRVLIENDPFALIEAATIAAFATGCEHGRVYLRGEYPRALATLTDAIDTARAAGLLGRDVMGAGFAFDLEIVRGAGAYICGEETAIFNSIEGFRGEPRAKPPYPVEAGLFGQPTLINNVETLMNVPLILRHGAAAYRALGTPDSPGPKLFCVSGSVATPGVFEVPFGTSLADLIGRAGGMRDGSVLQAVLLGGAAGGFIGPDDLDLPLSMEAARAAGTTLGSGVVLVLDDDVELTDQLLRIAAFFRDESCGQCVPCRVGTVRQEEVLVRLVDAPADRTTDLAVLRDLAQVMRDASICGLGQTASGAILSAIDRLGALR